MTYAEMMKQSKPTPMLIVGPGIDASNLQRYLGTF
jgi:hypothetical protein